MNFFYSKKCVYESMVNLLITCNWKLDFCCNEMRVSSLANCNGHQLRADAILWYCKYGGLCRLYSEDVGILAHLSQNFKWAILIEIVLSVDLCRRRGCYCRRRCCRELFNFLSSYPEPLDHYIFNQISLV